MNTLDNKEGVKVLMEFLRYTLSSGKDILERFAALDGAIQRGSGLEQFVYVRGRRKNKVLLVAHADTYWDEQYRHKTAINPEIKKDGNIVRSLSSEYGIGADDRAGCAMLWILKDLGHSLLLTNGEEQARKRGKGGSLYLMKDSKNQDIKNEIQRGHQFVVQLDRRNGRDFKCYSVGTNQFRKYIRETTGYTEPNRISSTDIVFLCKEITGVNLSIGYRCEHKYSEELNVEEWKNTLTLCRKWLSKPDLPKFSL